MSISDPFYISIGISPQRLTKEEAFLLEAEIVAKLYRELFDYFMNEFRQYSKIIKLSLEAEKIMLEENFIRLIINDIIATGEYTLEGISLYTGLPADVIYDLTLGLNNRPTAIFFIRIIKLHREVRRELYDAIAKKIQDEYIDN